MKIKEQSIDSLSLLLSVELEPKDYENQVNKILKKEGRKIEIRGFRKGKVPFGILKKLIGGKIIAEEVQKLALDASRKYFEEKNLEVLGQINEQEENFFTSIDQKNFNVKYNVAIAPNFEVNLSEYKIPFYDITVSEEMIDDSIKTVGDNFKKEVEVECVNDKLNNVLIGDFSELDENNNILENGISKKDAMISLEFVKDDEIKNLFKSAFINQVVNFNPKKAFPNDTEVTHLLGIKKEDAKDLNSDFQFIINKIKDFEEKEINQEFFDLTFGKDIVKSEEEFRAKIKEEIGKNLKDRDIFSRFTLDLKKALMTKLNFPFPDAFFKKYLKYELIKQKQNLNDEKFQEEFSNFKESFKWDLIVKKIIKENKISIDNEKEFLAFVKYEIATQIQSQGMGSLLNDDFLNNYAKETLKTEEKNTEFRQKFASVKFFDFMQKNITLDKKVVSVEDFRKLYQDDKK